MATFLDTLSDVVSAPVGSSGGGFSWEPSTFDFGDIITSAPKSLTLPTSAPSSFSDSLLNFGDKIASLAVHGYDNLAAIETAKAKVSVAQAAGQNATQVAKAGMPSTYLLLGGGAAFLLAMAALSKK